MLCYVMCMLRYCSLTSNVKFGFRESAAGGTLCLASVLASVVTFYSIYDQSSVLGH